MTELLKSRGINRFSTFSETKSATAERAIKTLMTRLERYFTYTNKTRFLEILPVLTDSYNSTIHSAHGFKPRDVTKDNEHIVWSRLYEKYFEEPDKKPKYKVGDRVIASKIRPLFRKGYKQTFNPEPYFIHEVKKTKPVVYILQDENKEVLEGSFYEAELQKLL